MCGRKAFNLTWREIHDLLEHGIFPERLEKLIQTLEGADGKKS